VNGDNKKGQVSDPHLVKSPTAVGPDSVRDFSGRAHCAR